ncbi:hypothetical protein ACWDUH_33130, partial [Micromonospora wenchangensis]
MQPVPALHPHPTRSRRPWPRLVTRPLLVLALVGGSAVAAPGATAAPAGGRTVAAGAANPDA